MVSVVLLLLIAAALGTVATVLIVTGLPDGGRRGDRVRHDVTPSPSTVSTPPPASMPPPSPSDVPVPSPVVPHAPRSGAPPPAPSRDGGRPAAPETPAGAAPSGPRPITPDVDVRVVLGADRATLHVSVAGAPPGSSVTVAIGGRLCADRSVRTAFDVDVRRCTGTGLRGRGAVVVSVTAGGRPVARSVVAVQTLLGNVGDVGEAVRGTVDGLRSGRVPASVLP